MAAAIPPGPDTTIAEYAARWLAGLDVRSATVKSYTISINEHVVPALGDIKLCDLTTGRVESFGVALTKSGMKATTARGVLSTFGTMLGSAVRDALITVNPAIGARRPRVASNGSIRTPLTNWPE